MTVEIAIIQRKITLQDLIILPLIPLIIDTFARILMLYDKLKWYIIPDYVTVLITFAFFNIGLMNSVKLSTIPSDNEVNLNIELVKRELLTIAILAIMFAGGVSFYRAVDEAYPDKFIAETHSFIVFLVVISFIIFNSFQIYTKYIKYVGS